MLDLFATAEFYREYTLSEARNALVWNAYYMKDATTISLAAEEEAFLQELEEKDASWRKMYMEIICQCCRMVSTRFETRPYSNDISAQDIYNCWTANPPSMTDLMIAMNEYFPRLNKNARQESPRLFHRNLSLEEQVQINKSGEACCVLIHDSWAWASENRVEKCVHIVSCNTEQGILTLTKVNHCQKSFKRRRFVTYFQTLALPLTSSSLSTITWSM